jgi:hypothetical protein
VVPFVVTSENPGLDFDAAASQVKELGVVNFGWVVENLRFPLCKETLGFHFRRVWSFHFTKKLGFATDLVFMGSTSSSGDLEIYISWMLSGTEMT